MNWIFQSRRVGKSGKEFTMYKIRTMRQDANVFTEKTEEHYTRFGRILRKYKIDELPQVWNVLNGDMAFFGWRPEEKWAFDLYPESVKKELTKGKPGIVDLASLYFYNEEEQIKTSNPEQTYWLNVIPQKLALQLFYIQNKSVLLNIALVYLVCKKIALRR